MRISDRTIIRNYMTSLSTGSEERAKANLKVSTGRAYQTVSEDPVAAMKAMKIRRSLARIDDYKGNITDLKAIAQERESAFAELSDITIDMTSLLQQGKTGTYSESDRASIASALRSYQETVYDIGNSSYCGKYIFGGTSEYEIPFSLDGSGNLLYHGSDVDSGSFAPEQFLMDISEGTAVNAAFSGATLLGSGVDGDGLSNNVYQFIGQMASAFENNDLSQMDLFSKKLTTIQGDVTVHQAEAGSQSQFISFFEDRLTATKTNLTERQTGLEGTDSAEAIMNYNLVSSAYDATLAMGAKIIPQTLLDYIS